MRSSGPLENPTTAKAVQRSVRTPSQDQKCRVARVAEMTARVSCSGCSRPSGLEVEGAVDSSIIIPPWKRTCGIMAAPPDFWQGEVRFAEVKSRDSNAEGAESRILSTSHHSLKRGLLPWQPKRR